MYLISRFAVCNIAEHFYELCRILTSLFKWVKPVLSGTVSSGHLVLSS